MDRGMVDLLTIGIILYSLIDILMIMTETQALTSHCIHGLKNIIM